jgi:WD40 repeat protein
MASGDPSFLTRPAVSEEDQSIAGFVASSVDHGHDDIVSVIKYNFYSDRFLTASSDHRVKVWHRGEGDDDEWQLSDTWTAHNAEVRDVRSSFSSLDTLGR